MRDFTRFNHYLNLLAEDIYEQPDNEGHTALARNVILLRFKTQLKNVKSVLDVGCGTGFCKDIFIQAGVEDWVGVTLGPDYLTCIKRGLEVYAQDMTFLNFGDSSFDLIFARHVIEHSPMPLITLMEWRRIAHELLIVVPGIDYWTPFGINHYSVLTKDQWKNLFTRAGWKIKAYNALTTKSEPFKYFHPTYNKRPEEHQGEWEAPPEVDFEQYFYCERI